MFTLLKGSFSFQKKQLIYNSEKIKQSDQSLKKSKWSKNNFVCLHLLFLVKKVQAVY